MYDHYTPRSSSNNFLFDFRYLFAHVNEALMR